MEKEMMIDLLIIAVTFGAIFGAIAACTIMHAVMVIRSEKRFWEGKVEGMNDVKDLILK